MKKKCFYLTMTKSQLLTKLSCLNFTVNKPFSCDKQVKMACPTRATRAHVILLWWKKVIPVLCVSQTHNLGFRVGVHLTKKCCETVGIWVPGCNQDGNYSMCVYVCFCYKTSMI